MNEQVKAVVEGFRRLTNGEQTMAYIEIEAIWKTLQDSEQIVPDAPPSKVASGTKTD
jgi:hypothetical protein